MSPKNAKLFLCRLNKNLNKKDLVLIGFDLKKNPKILYDSYNDSKGLFENLNLHLLERINKTLDANFNKDFFMHHSHYNPKSNALECYLYSTRNQTVRINLLKKEFHFKEWEAIQTEKSYKYSLDNIKILARKCDFKIIDCFYDSKKYFVVFLFETQKKSSKS